MMSKQYGCEDKDARPIGEAASGLNRRGLLGAAAGGFALAASGLFLPSGEETEAREGANGRKLGGRHGANRRGRDKQHAQKHRRDRKGDGKTPRGASSSPLGISIAVIYEVDDIKTHTEFWTARTGNWVREQSFSIEPGDHVSFQTKRTGATVWFAGRYYVGFNTQSELPTVTLGHGGAFGDHGWTGGTTFADAVPLDWAQVTPDMEIDDIFIRVAHTFDKDDNAQFVLFFKN